MVALAPPSVAVVQLPELAVFAEEVVAVAAESSELTAEVAKGPEV